MFELQLSLKLWPKRIVHLNFPVKHIVADYQCYFAVDFLYFLIDFNEDESFDKLLHFSQHDSTFACHFFALFESLPSFFNPQLAHSSFEMEQFLSLDILTSLGVQFCWVNDFQEGFHDFFKKASVSLGLCSLDLLFVASKLIPSDFEDIKRLLLQVEHSYFVIFGIWFSLVLQSSEDLLANSELILID